MQVKVKDLDKKRKPPLLLNTAVPSSNGWGWVITKHLLTSNESSLERTTWKTVLALQYWPILMTVKVCPVPERGGISKPQTWIGHRVEKRCDYHINNWPIPTCTKDVERFCKLSPEFRQGLYQNNSSLVCSYR